MTQRYEYDSKVKAEKGGLNCRIGFSEKAS